MRERNILEQGFLEFFSYLKKKLIYCLKNLKLIYTYLYMYKNNFLLARLTQTVPYYLWRVMERG